VNKFTSLFLVLLQSLLISCSAIKTPVTNQFKLSAFSVKPLTKQSTKQSILVTEPEAVAGYQTEQMMYMKTPFELSAFANNAWINPPAAMLFPLIMQSLQSSGCFYAVASSPHAEKTDYRIDTQLIELHQNFLCKPSRIDFAAKIVLTQVSDNRVIASRLMRQRVTCPTETPYGGVIAANRATENFTAELNHFVINQVRKDSQTIK